MELVRGRPLDLWRREEKPGQLELLGMYAEIGRGLAAIHREGVVHGDFKPANVLVEPLTDEERDGELGRLLPLGKPKIVDFGMALRLGEVARGGTPEYMPLELLNAPHTATFASDQYSFCVALFEDLLGCHPYVGQTFEEFAETARNSSNAMTPREVRANYITEIGANLRHGTIRWPELGRLPRWLRAALERGLAADPADRFPTMEPLLRALERPRLAALRRRRLRRGALAGLLGAAGAFAVAAASASDVDVCADLGDPASGVWNEEVRARLGDPRGAHAAVLFDPFVRAWQQTRRDTCEAGLVRGELSDALHDARVRCLDDRLREAKTLVGAITRGEIDPVDGATYLRPPQFCAVLERPAELVPAGREAEHRRIAEGLAGDALAAEIAGDYPRSLAITDELYSEAIAVGHRPLVAAVLYRRGRVALEQHRDHLPEDLALRARGEDDLARALRLAARAGDDATYTDAAIFQLRARAVLDPERAADSQALLELDLPGARQLPRVRAALRDAQGLLAFKTALKSPAPERDAHLRRARAALTEALPIYEAENLTIDRAKAHENLGEIVALLGEPAAAGDHLTAAQALYSEVASDAPSYLGTLQARLIMAAVGRDDGSAPRLCDAALAWVDGTEGAARSDDALATQRADIELACAAAYWSTPAKALELARAALAGRLREESRPSARLMVVGLLLEPEAPADGELGEASEQLAALADPPANNAALALAYRGRLALLQRKFSDAMYLLDEAREQAKEGLDPATTTTVLLDLAEARLESKRQGVDDVLTQAAHFLERAPQDAASARAQRRLDDLRRRAEDRP
jgi:hypothetical protein